MRWIVVLSVFIGVILSSTFLGVGVRAEDEGILIVSEEVTSQFPDGISFRISLKSQSTIDDIRVFYKSMRSGITSYGLLEFDAGTDVQAYYLLDAGSGGERGLGAFVPPGSRFEYSFEIKNKSGVVLRTQPKEFVYLDSRFEWRSIAEEPLTVYHYGPTDKRAEDILQAALRAVERMSRVLGVEKVQPINIVAYNNYRHMVVALPPRPQAISQDLVTEGQAFANLGVLMMLAFNEDAEGVASHEITHIVLDDAAGQAYNILPMWLNEGLAEFGNVLPTEDYDQALLYGAYTRRLKPLWHLRTFVGDPNDVIISYGQARSVVAYLINTYGEEKMAQFLRELQDILSIDRAMMQVYGIDQRGLDTEWRVHLGLRPLKVADAAGEPDSLGPAYAIEETPEASDTQTPMPKENETQPDPISPGCSGVSGSSSRIGVDPFILLLLAGPIGFLPFRRFMRRRKV